MRQLSSERLCRVWGEQNREAPLRLCRLEGSPEMTNMELKSMVRNCGCVADLTSGAAATTH